MNNLNLFPCKVLVVDDEPDIPYLIEQQFAESIKSKFLQFIFAKDGVEALNILALDSTFIAVLSDINLPVMNGLKLLQTISQEYPLVKTLIISAYGDMDNIRKAMQRGAYDFLIKPFDFADLNSTLQRAIQAGLTERKIHFEHIHYINLQKELEIASQIQQTFIPHSFDPLPNNKTYDLYGTMIPAVSVAGDFFDFFPLNENQLGLVIGDVCGKGIPEALTMAVVRTSLRCFAHTLKSLKTCLSEVNALLCQENPLSTFVTLLYGVLDLTNGTFKYCNAGHLPPILVSENGTIEVLNTLPAPALGIISDLFISEFTRQLKKNDLIFFYTDGVNEAMNTGFTQYSQPRLEAKLKELVNQPVEVIVKRIVEDIRLFTKGKDQSDDITLMCIRYK